MKKYMVIGLLCASVNFICSTDRRTLAKLLVAVENMDTTRVKKLLEKHPLTDTKSKELLVLAVEEVCSSQETVSLRPNIWDGGAFILGIIGGSYGVSQLYKKWPSFWNRLNESENPFTQWRNNKLIHDTSMSFNAASGTVLASLGVFLALRGWKCTSAFNAREKSAKHLQSVVKRFLTDGEKKDGVLETITDTVFSSGQSDELAVSDLSLHEEVRGAHEGTTNAIE
ncbi:hypothetical protein H0X06_01125 [Candidatus Dependentiae bacterium]|nr:hypothetical protein [Candidatus Dependentiae bacterium]